MASVGDKDSFVFTVAQWNILAKELASARHFPSVKEDNLNWSTRSEKILQNIQEMKTKDGNADIICLEELSEYWELFKDELAEKHGYNSVYCKRPSITVSSWSGKIKTDGCGIFYSSEKFKLIHQHSVNFSDTHDRVALVLLLKCIGPLDGAGYIVVANTHLYWDIRKVDVQLAELKQVQTAIEELMNYARIENSLEPSTIPIIFAGDFNNVPSSEIYRHMIDSFIQEAKMRSSYSNYQKSKITHTEPDSSGEYEPKATTVTHRRARTIDYIFYSSSLLEISSLQELPSIADLREEDGDPNWQSKVPELSFDPDTNYNGIPNANWGSDHIPICCSFRIKSCCL